MDEDKREPALPIRTLHDFLIALDKEWGTFRTGSLLSIISTFILLFLLFAPEILARILKRTGPLIDAAIYAGIFITLGYSVYLQYRQHSFYSRWEKRLGILLQLEEHILGGDEKEFTRGEHER